MKKHLLGIALLLAISSFAMATPTSCLTVTGTDVTTLTMGCMLGNLLFDQFSVTSAPPGTTVFLSALGTGLVSGGGVDLGFQITTPMPPVDTIFMYRVTGAGMTGVDNAHNGSGSTRIQEVVCAVPFVGGICPTGSVLANFVNPPTTMATFSSQGQIYIMKDIALAGRNDFISSFVNGVNGSVPEPGSAMLIGAGLVGLATLTRRFRKA